MFFLSPPCLAQSLPARDVDLLLLEVRLDQHVLTDSLTAYQKDRHVLLPLGELAQLLTLAIKTRPEQGTASGFVLQENRTFYLDLAQARAVLGDRTETVDPELVEVRPDDIYVASHLLARWLPLDLELDFSGLALRVRPREPLPLQLRLERERRGAQAGVRPYEDPGYPRHDMPYRLIDMPFIDQTVGVDARRSGGKTQVDARYAAFLTGDFLGLEAAAFLGAASRGKPDFRATLGRNDPEAGLLGPLRARSFAFGHIAVPAIANVSRTSPTGTGFQFGNRPLTQPASFDSHSLQGDLPPGWDVELYFNDALVGFQQARPDGQYIFDDLPLVYGPNEFRLVFHGPQGQVRVERKSFLLEQSLTPPGEFYYQIAQHRDDDGNPRAIARFDWGFNRNLSATGGVTSLPLAGAQQHYTNFGLRALWQSLLVSGDVVRSGDGGSLAELGIKTRLGKLTLGLSHAQLDDFSSDVFLAGADPIRTRDQIRLDGVVAPTFMPRLPVTLEAKRDRLESGTENVEASGRISTHVAGTSLTNQLRWQTTGGAESADGNFQMSRRVGGLGLRGQIGYALTPETGLTTVSFSADRNLALGYLLNMGVTRDVAARQTQYTIGLNKSIGAYGLRVSGSYSTRGEVTLGTQLFMAMGREPLNSAWVFDALPMADSGAVSARVFVDRNLNGVMDADEEPIEGAGFLVNGGRRPGRTDGAGMAYLGRLPVRQNVDVGIDPATLEDPQWSARPGGARLVPRPGKTAVLTFPVIMTSEIDGTVYLIENDKAHSIGDVFLELIDARGNVVGEAKSASDGFYIVPSVPPGDYRLRVSPKQLARLNLTDTGTRLITVSPDGTFLNGVDFYLVPLWEPVFGQAPPVSVAPPAAAAPAPAHGAEKRYYTVREGDWLWKITKMFYGEATAANANEIVQANRDILQDRDGLRPGQRLRIPADAPLFPKEGMR